VNNWDAVVVGAGVIGLSLAWRLRREGLRVLIIDKGEPAREATHAAGGMIAHCDPQQAAFLLPLAQASAAMYPEFVHELTDESGESPDLRDAGTIFFAAEDEAPSCEGARQLSAEEVQRLESAIETGEPGYWLPERSVDPRGLGSALVKAAKHRGVDFVTGSPAIEVQLKQGSVVGVRTTHSSYSAAMLVNCAGAWASEIQPIGLPTRPVKGQMVCVVPAPGQSGEGPLVKHVVRTPEIYIIPRSDGRILLGATVEEAGFDKRTDAETIQRLHRAATQVAPVIGEMRMLEAWAGLRPGSPDDLPMLGETATPGYFAATGHYRDGIMLAPITAQLMTQLLTGKSTDFDLQPFSPLRFG
jgi:glycine oxidase